MTPTRPRTIEDLIEASRKVRSATSFDAFIDAMRKTLPGPTNPHGGLLSGKGILDFQNWQLDHNPKWRLSDAQLLAVMRTELPQATGKVFTGSLDEGLDIVVGIRRHYNRDGHHGPSPQSRGFPPSVSYGRI